MLKNNDMLTISIKDIPSHVTQHDQNIFIISKLRVAASLVAATTSFDSYPDVYTIILYLETSQC
jgi:hypothetical protein